MVWNIIQLLISIGIIIGGLSGKFVLRGTNSSAALVAVGVLWLVYDISRFITFKRKANNIQREPRQKKRIPWFYIFNILYIAANLFAIFFLIDELIYSDDKLMSTLAIFGNIVSIAGIIILLTKHSFGISIALAGSAATIAFTIFTGVFVIGLTPHFDTAGFVGFMLISILPGLFLSLQMKFSKNVAKHDSNISVRRKAVLKPTDQSALTDIAEKDNDPKVYDATERGIKQIEKELKYYTESWVFQIITTPALIMAPTEAWNKELWEYFYMKQKDNAIFQTTWATFFDIGRDYITLTSDDILNEPIRWLSNAIHQNANTIQTLLGLRLFMVKGTFDYEFKQYEYSACCYFSKIGNKP